MQASTIAIAVVTNPSPPRILATAGPPGTHITSGPGNSFCTLISAANMKRNGTKYEMMLMLTSTSYAPRTDVPAWPSTTNTAEIPACTSSAT